MKKSVSEFSGTRHIVRVKPSEELGNADDRLRQAQHLLARELSRFRWWTGQLCQGARNVDTRRKLLMGAMAVYLYREPHRWPSQQQARFEFRHLFARRLQTYLKKPAREFLKKERLAEGMVAFHLLLRPIPSGLSLCALREKHRTKTLILFGAVLLAELRDNAQSTNILRMLIERDYGPKEWSRHDKETLLSLCKEILNQTQPNKEIEKP